MWAGNTKIRRRFVYGMMEIEKNFDIKLNLSLTFHECYCVVPDFRMGFVEELSMRSTGRAGICIRGGVVRI